MNWRIFWLVFCLSMPQNAVCETETECGGVLLEPSGWISPPDRDGDGQYDNLEDCEWNITVAEGYVVVLDIMEMDLEEQARCPYDYLRVLDGNRVLGTYCGTVSPGSQLSSAEVLIVRFHSDDSETGKGFTAFYSSLDVSACDYRVTSITGIIQSPGRKGDNAYDTSYCIWTIFAASNQLVQLLVTEMDIPSTGSCETGYLKVYDDDVLIDMFCEKELPDLITSSSRHVRVEFRTDEDRVGKGFSIFHAAIDEDYMCSGILMEPTGMIESPDRNGDGVYDLFLDCVWIIIAPKGKGIQMEFPSFSLEQSFKCTYDKVILFDGIDNYEKWTVSQDVGYDIGMYCYDDKPGVTNTTSNILVLYFFSDKTETEAGFRALYRHIDVPVPSTVKTSTNANTQTSTTTYVTFGSRRTDITTADYAAQSTTAFATTDVTTDGFTTAEITTDGVTTAAITTDDFTTAEITTDENVSTEYTTPADTTTSVKPEDLTHQDTSSMENTTRKGIETAPATIEETTHDVKTQETQTVDSTVELHKGTQSTLPQSERTTSEATGSSENYTMGHMTGIGLTSTTDTIVAITPETISETGTTEFSKGNIATLNIFPFGCIIVQVLT